LISLFFWTACSGKDDVDLIREMIRKGAKLAEKHDAKGLMELTSEDFLALPGKHDRPGVRNILWMAFRHYGEFKVTYPEPAVDLKENPDEAFARIYFLILKEDRTLPELDKLRKDPRGWLEEVGENADLYRLELQLLKKNDGWLVREVSLESFTGLGFSE
jgi:hypothetical protein